MMEDSYLVPQQLGQITKVSEPVEIAKLRRSHSRKDGCGKVLSVIRLKEWAWGSGRILPLRKERTVEEIIRAIVYPDEKLAHGYDKPVRLTSKRNKTTAEGLLSNYSWHAGSLKLKIMGGDTRKILFRRAGARVEYLEDSWMPSASEMGLSDQDLANLAAYMQTQVLR